MLHENIFNYLANLNGLNLWIFSKLTYGHGILPSHISNLEKMSNHALYYHI
jgi:hypothetical protein